MRGPGVRRVSGRADWLWPRVVVALLAALLASGPLSAQTVTTAPQILTLSQDRFYAESLYGKALEAKAATASQALAAENRQIEADLSAEEADLTKKRATMTGAEFQTLADAFDAKVEKLRRDQAAKVAALTAQNEAGRKAFFQAAVPVLATVMRQMGAYAILNQSAVILSFDAIDVTDRAIAALDAELGDGSDLPAGPRVQPLPDMDLQQGTTAAPQVGAPGDPAPVDPVPVDPAPGDRVPDPAPQP